MGLSAFYGLFPPRIVIVPEVAIDDFPTENSVNLVRSGGVFKAIQNIPAQVEKIRIEVTADEELTIFGESAVALAGGGFFNFGENVVIDATSLDAGNAFIMGQDYYIYICESASVTILISLDGDFPAGFDKSTSRKIGGFHYGVNRRSTADPADVFIGIVPRSIWTLFHRPKCDPEGMVYLSGGVWVDIYTHFP